MSVSAADAFAWLERVGLREHVRKLAADAPPMSDEQRAYVARLLAGPSRTTEEPRPMTTPTDTA